MTPEEFCRWLAAYLEDEEKASSLPSSFLYQVKPRLEQAVGKLRLGMDAYEEMAQ